jgi:flavin reductase (DIM6/NTAB) family NADH-FMN oxidoreductase RutF
MGVRNPNICGSCSRLADSFEDETFASPAGPDRGRSGGLEAPAWAALLPAARFQPPGLASAEFTIESRLMKKSLGAKTLLYPAPVLVVGTYDKAERANMMTASWGGICSSQPPCVAIAVRRATQSYQNLMARKAFTISIPSEKYVKEADYFGLVSGRTTDKLAATKLTPTRSKLVDAPYIKEFPLVLECKVVDVADLGLHTQFVGEVLDAKAEDTVLGRDGAIDIKKLRPLVFTPDTQEYFGIGSFVAKVFSAGQGI